MSAFVCILHRDGTAVEPRELHRLAGPLASYGDETASYCRGPLGLAVRHRGRAEDHLRVDARTGVVAAVAGRFTALDGLPAGGAGAAALLAARGDADPILLAAACGSFAVLVTDPARGRLVLARDHLGDVAVHYRLDRRRLLAASDPAALLLDPAVPGELDEAAVTRFLAFRSAHDGRSFFRHVRTLPPAHRLEVSPDAETVEPYWRFRRLPAASDAPEEVAAGFRQRLERAVARAVAGVDPRAVAVSLSGGLDSTAVAALAARELAARGSERPLTTLSWLFEELPGADEREYVEAMVEAWGLDAVRIGGDDAWPLSDLASWPRNLNGPLEGVYRRLVERSYRAAGERGISVVLTGDYGNHLDAGSVYWLRDLVREGRLAAAGGAALAELVSEPRRFVRAAARTLGRRRGGPPEPSWLTPGARALAGGREGAGGGLTAARLRSLLDPRGAHAVSLEVANAARAGIEVRRPFRDRRLVEMALALPAHQLYRPGRDRWLLRRAVAGIVPDAVRLRRRRTTLLPLCARGLVEREADAVGALLAPARALWRRFVRSDWLAAAFPQRLRAGLDGVESVVPWRCICGELWRDGLAAAGLLPDLSPSIPIPTTTTGASR